MERISTNQMHGTAWHFKVMLTMTESVTNREWARIANRHAANFKTDLCDMK